MNHALSDMSGKCRTACGNRHEIGSTRKYKGVIGSESLDPITFWTVPATGIPTSGMKAYYSAGMV